MTVTGVCVTWKGVLILLTSVSSTCTLSCVCSRMKDRKVCRRAGSETDRRKRSRYAVVVITSSTVSYTHTHIRICGMDKIVFRVCFV